MSGAPEGSDGERAEREEGKRLMWSGVALGAVGAASALVLGATCPLCVVGAPALVGWGAYKRFERAPAPEDAVGATEP